MHDESVIRCHLKPAFGELRLNQLTTARCKDFRKKLQDDELSGKTAGNILAFCTRRWPTPSKMA